MHFCEASFIKTSIPTNMATGNPQKNKPQFQDSLLINSRSSFANELCDMHKGKTETLASFGTAKGLTHMGINRRAKP